MMTVMLVVTVFVAFIRLYDLPLLIMQRNSPTILVFYLNEWENPVDDLWHHSLIYWLLLGFDCSLLYAMLTFLTLLGIIALNLLTGIPLILATLGTPINLKLSCVRKSCYLYISVAHRNCGRSDGRKNSVTTYNWLSS